MIERERERDRERSREIEKIRTKDTYHDANKDSFAIGQLGALEPKLHDLHQREEEDGQEREGERAVERHRDDDVGRGGDVVGRRHVAAQPDGRRLHGERRAGAWSGPRSELVAV